MKVLLIIATIFLSSYSEKSVGQLVGEPVTCNTITVMVNAYHNMSVTLCSDGSGTEFHAYLDGSYCVFTWDANGAEFRNCGKIRPL